MMEKFYQECKKIAGKYGDKLELPPKGIADFALPCFSFSKNPVEEAKKLAEKFSKKIGKNSLIKEIKAQGPYVNFYVNNKVLASSVIKEILKNERYGSGKNKGRVMVEYSAPNSNKPLHIGHLRNDSIGMSISRILEYSGFKVIKANLINDRGIHICKVMVAYEKWDGKKHGKGDKFVGNLYVMFEKNKTPSLEEKAKEFLKKWEQGDKKTRALWKKLNSMAIKGIKQTYKKFGSEFDVWFFESEFYNKVEPIIQLGLKKGIFKRIGEKGIIAVLEKYGLPNKIVIREDGTSVYIANDLALTKHKFEKFKLDKSIWCVAYEQNLYFKQLFKIFELLGFKWAEKCHHLSYGLVNLPSGRLKSREGNVVDADDLIDEMTKLALKEIKKRYKNLSKKECDKRAKEIALASIKFFFLKNEPLKDMLFDPEKAISFEGNTGPYLQYTYARAKSILRKSDKKALIKGELNENEFEIIKKLSLFPLIVKRSAENLKPNYLVNYLLELAMMFNEYYHSTKVIGSPNEEIRLSLIQCIANVIKKGLWLLGINVLEEM